MNTRLPFIFALLLVPSTALHAAELKLAAVFSQHMVLQRDHAIPVWGWADAGEKVNIEFAGQSKQMIAESLRWHPALADGRSKILNQRESLSSR